MKKSNLKALLLRTSFWVTDFFKGSPIRRPYDEIRYIQEHYYNESLSIRKMALHKLMDYARKHSPFYANVNGYNLQSFPVMNKHSLIANYDMIKVPENEIPGQKGQVHIQTTSGSTGIPFRIPQDTRKRFRRVAELKYFGKIVGFNTHDKLVHMRTWNKWQQKTIKQIWKENIIPFDIACLDDENLLRLCNLLQTSKAVCIRGYASTLGKLAEFADGKGFTFPYLKVAIAGAESLQDDTRFLYKRVMQSEIISQYANEECGIIAQEMLPTKDSNNLMYMNNASYFFEILKFENDEPAEFGELGRIVITDLYNYAFPLIRYDCGDVGMFLPADEYSKGFPVLGKLYGRRFDLTYSTEGKPIFPLTYGRIIKHYENIAQWQFIQETENEYSLKVVMRGDNLNIDEIVTQFKDYLGPNALIKIEIVDDIPMLASGKHKPVVNNWKQH